MHYQRPPSRLLHVAFVAAAMTLVPPLVNVNAQDGVPQDCFGPPPYNCFSLGDIPPGAPDGSYETLYQAYAHFAWQDFLALNFPAKQTPEGPVPIPDRMKGLDYLDGKYTTVWETYAEARDLFQPDGSAPPPFGSGTEVPAICLQEARVRGKDNVHVMVSQIAKADTIRGGDVLDEYIQANRMGPVIDQNGKYVRFGISFNEAIYDYIVDNDLYTPEGQAAFDANDPDHSGSPVQWPRGAYSDVVDKAGIGSIMVKAAWKVLGDQDDASKFHTIDGFVYNAANGAFGQEPRVEESCTVEKLALVGLHIVHRTNSSPQWVWSTFEHIDNAPWMADFRVSSPTGSYSFFNPETCPSHLGAPAPSCRYNEVPDHPWNPERTDLTPTTVIRIGAPGRYAIVMNKAFRDRLRQSYGIGGTVWENYFLLDVQFPTVTLKGEDDVREVNPAYPDGLPTPTFLPNALIETYIQGFTAGDITSNGNAVPDTDQMQNVSPNGGPVNVDPWNPDAIYNKSGGAQRNSSSCIGCHADGAMTNGTFSTYVFSLSRARSPNNENEKPLRDWLKGLGEK